MFSVAILSGRRDVGPLATYAVPEPTPSTFHPLYTANNVGKGNLFGFY